MCYSNFLEFQGCFTVQLSRFIFIALAEVFPSSQRLYLVYYISRRKSSTNCINFIFNCLQFIIAFSNEKLSFSLMFCCFFQQRNLSYYIKSKMSRTNCINFIYNFLQFKIHYLVANYSL